jgi:hypothetical protein
MTFSLCVDEFPNILNILRGLQGGLYKNLSQWSVGFGQNGPDPDTLITRIQSSTSSKKTTVLDNKMKV